jgi:hypothetical protein
MQTLCPTNILHLVIELDLLFHWSSLGRAAATGAVAADN